MRARTLFAIASTALLVTITGTPVPANQEAPARVLDWKPCPDNAAVDCASTQVPADWANPGGEQITVAVTRQKAAKQDQRIGALFLVGTSRLTTTPPALAERFDLINYTTVSDKSCRIRMPDTAAFPRDDAELDRVRNVMRNWYLACAKQMGAGFVNDDSASAAKDIDAIRAALGEQQISLMQTWENEIIGQMYAERYPRRVRALVLDGNMDHSIPTAGRYLAEKANAVEATFTAFADWCQRTPRCALHGRDVRTVYLRLRAKADKGQLGDLAPKDLSIHIGSAGDYPDLYWFRLAEFYRDLDSGGKPTPPSTADPKRAGTNAAPPGSKLPTVLRRGLSYGSFCQDWNYPIADHAQLTAIIDAEAHLAPHVLINHNHWFNVVGCLGWPFKTGNPPHRLVIPHPLKALVVNTSYAPGQPANWADSVAAQIPGSVRLVYEGPGTLAYRESKCVADEVDRFLITLDPPRRATCPGIWPE